VAAALRPINIRSSGLFLYRISITAWNFITGCLEFPDKSR
jgi:hypothetical protein